MTDKPYIAGALLGAAVGSAIGYFYFTEAGRRHRDAMGEMLDRMLVDVKELRTFWTRVNLAIDEYQTTVRDALDARASQPWASEPRGVA